AQLWPRHSDPESFVESPFDLHPCAFGGLEVTLRADQRVPLAVVGRQPPEPAFQVDEFDGPGDLHRSDSRASRPRPATQATRALASNQKGIKREGIHGNATVRQSAACSSVPAQPKASPAAAAPNAFCSGRA